MFARIALPRCRANPLRSRHVQFVTSELFGQSNARGFSRSVGRAQKLPASPAGGKSTSKIGTLPLQQHSGRIVPDNRVRKFEKAIAKQWKGKPIVVFEAPSHKGYIIGAYTVAAFAYLYAGFNAYTTIFDTRVNTATWVKAAYGGVCIVMTAMGTVFLLRGTRLISTITAVQTDAGTRLNFQIRRMVPFLKKREFSMAPSQLTFSRRLVVPSEEMTVKGRALAKLRRQKHTEVSELSFFRAPLKKFNFSVFRVFMSFRRLFTQEHFVFLKIKDRRGAWKLDSTGKISHEFLLLDSLVTQSP